MKREIKYLIVGGLNTVFSYFFSVLVYSKFDGEVNFFLLATIVNIVSIFVSYINMKTLVFKTRGNFISEISKAYLSYSLIGVLGVIIMFLLYEKIGINVYVSQLMASMITISSSYILNSRVTFNEKNN